MFIVLFDSCPKQRILEEETVEKWTNEYGEYMKVYNKKNSTLQSCLVDKDFNLNKRRTLGISCHLCEHKRSF